MSRMAEGIYNGLTTISLPRTAGYNTCPEVAKKTFTFRNLIQDFNLTVCIDAPEAEVVYTFM